MNKKIIIFIVLLPVLIAAGCQVTRTRKQASFDPNISAKTRACQVENCHEKESKDYYGQYRFSHNKHFSNTDAKNCNACHKEKKHGTELFEELDIKSYKDFKDSDRSGPVELKLKFESCRKCHKLEKMSSAHGSWSSKVKKYKPVKETHGKEARADMKSCNKCHQPEFCRVCHQVDMPHPSNWLKKHGPLTTIKSTSQCIICHSDANKKSKKMSFCFTCHAVPMPHPKNIKTTHDTLVSQVGVKGCWQCHDKQAFCTKCHKTEMPHSSGFIKTHYIEIKSLTPNSCVQCHDNDPSSTSGCFGGDCHTRK